MYLNFATRRPGGVVLCIGLMTLGACAWSLSLRASAVGGEQPRARGTHQLESRLQTLRSEQVIRARRTDILREQLTVLETAIDDPHGAAPDELRAVRDALLALLLDERAAEQEIAASVRELWDAQGYAERASRRPHGEARVSFDWPVEPLLGISAHYDDAAYRARFGFAHKAIDIPVDQGSIVRSVADGVVEKVSDQGLGFNSLVIRHAGGYASLYGHVTEFLVKVGDEVSKGDAIARSGGMPGSPGAGRMTTGPHLHLEMFRNGGHVDPLPLFPERETVLE